MSHDDNLTRRKRKKKERKEGLLNDSLVSGEALDEERLSPGRNREKIDHTAYGGENIDAPLRFEELSTVKLEVPDPKELETARAAYVADKQMSESERNTMFEVLEIIRSGLRQWKHFEARLPPTVFREKFEFTTGSFVTNDEDLRLSALNENGVQKKLNADQLRQVIQFGYFDVKSVTFMNVAHRWQLSHLFVLGNTLITKYWREAISFGLCQFVVQMPRRIVGANSFFPTLRDALWRPFRFMYDLADLVVGMPHSIPKYNIDSYVALARLGAALKNADTQCVDSVVHSVELNGDDDALSWDVRMFWPKSLEKIQEALQNALANWSKVRVSFLQKVSREAADKTLSGVEAQKYVNDRCNEERNRLIVECIRDRFANDTLDAHIDCQVRALLIVEEERARATMAMRDERRFFEEALRARSPILSLNAEWMEERVHAFINKYVAEHAFDAAEAALRRLRAVPDLAVYAELSARDIEFRRNGARLASERARGLTKPTYTFSSSRRIWNPKNWPIEKTSGKYYAIKNVEWETTSRSAFWRPIVTIKRLFVLWSNALFFLVPVMLINSPVGIRSLVGLREFRPETVVNPQTGELETGKMRVGTIVSRLTSLWSNVFESRRRYEQRPDTGLISKACTRVPNVIWNYVVKGLIGSCLLVGIGVPVTILCICACIVLALTSPVWVPAVTLIAYLFDLLFLDTWRFGATRDNRGLIPRLFGDILVMFVAQSVLAVLAFAVVHPLLGLLSIVLGSARAGLRLLYDRFMFYSFIRFRGRVPISNSFVARRVKGGALAAQHHKNISCDGALVALRAHMEKLQLTYFNNYIRELGKYADAFSRRNVTRILSPLSTAGVSFDIDRRVERDALKVVSQLIQERGQVLPSTPVLGGSARQTLDQLEETIVRGEVLVKRFVENCILPSVRAYSRHMNCDVFAEAPSDAADAAAADAAEMGAVSAVSKAEDRVNDWWAQYDLLPNDWTALTKQLLREALGRYFTEAIEDADVAFALELDQLSIGKFLNLLERSNMRDHLTKAIKVYENAEEADETIRVRLDSYMSTLTPPQPCVPPDTHLIGTHGVYTVDPHGWRYERFFLSTRAQQHVDVEEKCVMPGVPPLLPFGGHFSHLSVRILRDLTNDIDDQSWAERLRECEEAESLVKVARNQSPVALRKKKAKAHKSE